MTKADKPRGSSGMPAVRMPVIHSRNVASIYSYRRAILVAAAQLAAIGELFACPLSRCSDTEEWAIDTMEAVTAELAAASRISQGLAVAGCGMPEPCASGCQRWPKSSEPARSIIGRFRRSSIALI